MCHQVLPVFAFVFDEQRSVSPLILRPMPNPHPVVVNYSSPMDGLGHHIAMQHDNIFAGWLSTASQTRSSFGLRQIVWEKRGCESKPLPSNHTKHIQTLGFWLTSPPKEESLHVQVSLQGPPVP